MARLQVCAAGEMDEGQFITLLNVMVDSSMFYVFIFIFFTLYYVPTRTESAPDYR